MFRYNDAGNGDILINRIDVHATNSTTIFAPLSWYGFQDMLVRTFHV